MWILLVYFCLPYWKCTVQKQNKNAYIYINAFYLYILNVFYSGFKVTYYNARDGPTRPEYVAFIDEIIKTFVVDVDRQYFHFDLTYYIEIIFTEKYCLVYFYENVSSSRKLCWHYSRTTTVKIPDIATCIYQYFQTSSKF